MSLTKRSTLMVVEGAGDVVNKNYFPALRDLKKKGHLEFDVIFIDNSSFWKGDATLGAKMLGIRKALEEWGAVYLDKDRPDDRHRCEDLSPDVVIVATPDYTHADVASHWLMRNVQRIFVEKP